MDPGGEYEPAEQFRQAVAKAELEYSPGLQALHPLAGELLTLPSSQLSQFDLLVEDLDPTVQGWQLV